MKIAVLGGDGYCGWATALYLSTKGHSVSIIDNFLRRQWDHELGAQTSDADSPLSGSLAHLEGPHRSSPSRLFVGDVTDYDFLLPTLEPLSRRPSFISPNSGPRPIP